MQSCDGLVDPLLAVDRDLALAFLAVLFDERAIWTNMPPDPQAGSKIRPWNGSMISTISWTMDGGREELAALLPFGIGELAEEVLVDLAERVALDVHRASAVKFFEQRDRAWRLSRLLVRLAAGRPSSSSFSVFDGLHRFVDGLADVLAFGQLQQVRETGLSGR